MDVLAMKSNGFVKQDEKIYERWFQYVDADGDGRVTGNDAVKFFSLSQLSRPELKQIISLGQTGNAITPDILKNAEVENISPPVMEGLDELLEMTNGKQSPTLSELHSNGSSPRWQAQSFYWFTSKNSKKTASDFDSKPMVMLLGQYSTGKTTFIKHLLGSSYPGAHVGSEPTTDRFVVVMINEFFKHAQVAKIHSYIISHLKKEMHVVMGKGRAQQCLIENLEEEFIIMKL